MHIPRIALIATLFLFATSVSLSAETVTIPGCPIQLIDQARVAAEESGILTKVFAQEGQQVEAGQPLAKVDDKLAILQRNVAEAELKVARKEAENFISVKYAKATADVAFREVMRHKEANEKIPNAIAQSDVDKARLALDEAKTYIEKALFDLEIKESEVKVKEASLEAANEHIERRTVIAPWAGAVNEVGLHEGDWVEPGSPILSLIRMDKLRVSCILDADRYNPADVNGQPVRITVQLARGEKTSFDGTVTGISPVMQMDNEFQVWAEVINKKHRGNWILRKNMTADVEIQLNQ